MDGEQDHLPIVCATSRRCLARMNPEARSLELWCRRCHIWHSYTFRMLLRTYLDALEEAEQVVHGHKQEDVLHLPHGGKE